MLCQYPKEVTTLCGMDVEKVILVVVTDKPKEYRVNATCIPTDRFPCHEMQRNIHLYNRGQVL